MEQEIKDYKYYPQKVLVCLSWTFGCSEKSDVVKQHLLTSVNNFHFFDIKKTSKTP